MAQNKMPLIFRVSGAASYPAKIAYAVLDTKGKELSTGFFTVKSPNELVRIELALPDIFGVSIFEDANGNGALDFGVFGQPTEKYAFSNGAWKFLGKPEPELTWVRKDPKGTTLDFELKSVWD
ncbi:MAG: hypothetical protein RLZZ599_1379 [Bacteroidota bacterium]